MKCNGKEQACYPHRVILVEFLCYFSKIMKSFVLHAQKKWLKEKQSMSKKSIRRKVNKLCLLLNSGPRKQAGRQASFQIITKLSDGSKFLSGRLLERRQPQKLPSQMEQEDTPRGIIFTERPMNALASATYLRVKDFYGDFVWLFFLVPVDKLKFFKVLSVFGCVQSLNSVQQFVKKQ